MPCDLEQHRQRLGVCMSEGSDSIVYCERDFQPVQDRSSDVHNLQRLLLSPRSGFWRDLLAGQPRSKSGLGHVLNQPAHRQGPASRKSFRKIHVAASAVRAYLFVAQWPRNPHVALQLSAAPRDACSVVHTCTAEKGGCLCMHGHVVWPTQC